MATILTPAPHLTLSQVEMQVKQSREGIEKVHWQIIRLLLKGKRCPEVAEILGLSVGWVREIVRRYNKDGLDGLGDGRKTNGGNRWILTPPERTKLAYALEHEQPKEGGLWTSEKVRSWVKEKTGKDMTVVAAWEYFRRLGFSARILRPRHSSSDQEKQAEFKKKHTA